jgi:hypothetical protein
MNSLVHLDRLKPPMSAKIILLFWKELIILYLSGAFMVYPFSLRAIHTNKHGSGMKLIEKRMKKISLLLIYNLLEL